MSHSLKMQTFMHSEHYIACSMNWNCWWNGPNRCIAHARTLTALICKIVPSSGRNCAEMQCLCAQILIIGLKMHCNVHCVRVLRAVCCFAKKESEKTATTRGATNSIFCGLRWALRVAFVVSIGALFSIQFDGAWNCHFAVIIPFVSQYSSQKIVQSPIFIMSTQSVLCAFCYGQKLWYFCE